jgi:hypothetical protein
VRCEEYKSDRPIIAKGVLSIDGQTFVVIVETSSGKWSHDRGWEELMCAVNAFSD